MKDILLAANARHMTLNAEIGNRMQAIACLEDLIDGPFIESLEAIFLLIRQATTRSQYECKFRSNDKRIIKAPGLIDELCFMLEDLGYQVSKECQIHGEIHLHITIRWKL